ncbi:hypothetical protein [Streptomyces sp. NPDC059753]|uniref:hypothetical protein n=1 Tax=Streptomyces sp. NPDC059753 TaxID=3346933 RepID=UPI00364AE965
MILAAQAKDRTPAGIALALESARLLMSPETAAELEQLRSWKTADEKVQPHREAISTANMHHIARLEQQLRRVRFLHAKHTDSEHCQHDGEPWPCPTLAALDAPVGEVCHPCGCPKRFARHADGCPTLAAVSVDRLTALLAPTQALREESHDGPLHHDYRIGRDMPETGGVR